MSARDIYEKRALLAVEARLRWNLTRRELQQLFRLPAPDDVRKLEARGYRLLKEAAR